MVNGDDVYDVGDGIVLFNSHSVVDYYCCITPDQITDSPPYKQLHIGPRRHYPNRHPRWEPLPDNREHTARTFRFADQSRKSQRSLW